jgi:FkbM family methyltransferase
VVRGRRVEVRNEHDHIELSRYLHQAFSRSQFRLSEEYDLAYAEFEFMQKRLRFYFRKELAQDAIDVLEWYFLSGQYKRLETKSRDVLDIGANIGDTAIYFAMRGAKRVISLEVFPMTFEIAKLNIEKNGFDKIITLLNEGAGISGNLSLDPGLLSRRSSEAHDSGGSTSVRINSLSEMVTRFGLQDAILKINCEGCEYDLFSDASDEVLRHFSQVMLEYHYHGAQEISRALKQAGFSVKVFDREYFYDRDFAEPRCETGFIFATR